MAKAKSQLIANPSPNTTTTSTSPETSATAPQTTSTSGGGLNHVPTVTNNDVERPEPSGSANLDKADNASSHNISISSITEDEDDNGHIGDDGSSAFESSDSECDDEQIKKAIERIPNTLQPGSQLVRHPTEPAMALAATVQERPNIGSIAVQNSSDITFGNKTYIKGQVVIKNIYHERQGGNGGGVVNEGYRETDGEMGFPTSQQKKDLSSQPNEPPSWRSSLKTIIRDKPLLSAIVLMGLMLIIVTVSTVVYVTTSAGKPRYKLGDGDDDRAYVPPNTGIGDDFLPDAKPLRLVTRNEWLAQPPREKLDLLQLPVHKVIIAHTATEECTTQSACIYRVRFIQDHHISVQNYGDIGYNFLIGGDGNAYEGRGWLKVGAFLKGQNTKSVGISFIGDYRHYKPKKAQMELLNDLLANGTKGGYLKPDFKLFGACQLQPTESPGKLLYEELKKHPHWSDEYD